jgi:hypothetical protein
MLLAAGSGSEAGGMQQFQMYWGKASYDEQNPHRLQYTVSWQGKIVTTCTKSFALHLPGNIWSQASLVREF